MTGPGGCAFSFLLQSKDAAVRPAQCIICWLIGVWILTYNKQDRDFFTTVTQPGSLLPSICPCVLKITACLIAKNGFAALCCTVTCYNQNVNNQHASKVASRHCCAICIPIGYSQSQKVTLLSYNQTNFSLHAAEPSNKYYHVCKTANWETWLSNYKVQRIMASVRLSQSATALQICYRRTLLSFLVRYSSY